MKLSNEEMKWLKRWEKNERGWPIGRWVIVFFGALNTIGGILVFHFTIPLLKIPVIDISNTLVLLLFPLFFFGMAIFCFCYALANWRGNIKRRLLLRLIRQHQDEEA
jgi:hypothetical protein